MIALRLDALLGVKRNQLGNLLEKAKIVLPLPLHPLYLALCFAVNGDRADHVLVVFDRYPYLGLIEARIKTRASLTGRMRARLEHNLGFSRSNSRVCNAAAPDHGMADHGVAAPLVAPAFIIDAEQVPVDDCNRDTR